MVHEGRVADGGGGGGGGGGWSDGEEKGLRGRDRL